MPKTVVIDELHVEVRTPRDRPEGQVEAAVRTLAGDDFMRRLRQAVQGVVRSFPELAGCRVSVTR